MKKNKKTEELFQMKHVSLWSSWCSVSVPANNVRQSADCRSRRRC